MKTFEHGGNIHKVARNQERSNPIIDFSANINPLGPPEWLRGVVSSALENVVHYPDPDNREFVQAIAEHTGVNRECIVSANGTTELLYVISRVISAKRALIPVPSYVDYVRAARLGGLHIETFPLLEDDDFQLRLHKLGAAIQPGDLVIIGTPNNPTGVCSDREQLLGLAKKHPETFFIFDEAFLDFLGEDLSLASCAPNIITINSMTKFYGVPGLRIGYGTFPPDIANLVRENLPPWTVNSLAQAVGVKALRDSEYQRKTRQLCKKLRIDLIDKLRHLRDLKVYEASANYLFIKIIKGKDNSELIAFCLDHGIMIRSCDNYNGLDSSFIRIAVRNEKENAWLMSVLSDFYGRKSTKKTRKRQNHSIMFQGTSSDAGKSIMTAALCRILSQDGVKVAPFKSQNMSLNSFVTLQGDEMGRAQVVQSQAARLDPDCRMNPILLKPNSDTGSQVIVQGKPVGNMSVLEYNAYKPKCWLAVQESFDSLAAEYDVVVLEGAGSPGEVNLKADDIVNMKMAQYAESPVILVGDIDRGGIYASFVGTMEVLAEWERQLIAGFIVNKFRGQASLLDSAHAYVKNHTGREVMGVIPYLSNLGLPEEDSVSFKKGIFNRKREREDSVDIVTINLPHISNFTDIEPFLGEPDVNIRIANKPSEVGTPHAIILPGSKNVIHDLQFLQSTGFDKVIHENINNGCEIVGICGGYQMLGNAIRDPFQIESGAGQIQGLGFLNLTTVISKSKRLTRVNGVHKDSGTAISGYEIHHGVSTESGSPLFVFDDNGSCGTVDGTGQVWGCYLHGVFDSDEFRRWFIDGLRDKAGLQRVGKIIAPYDLEIAFDRLADCVRSNVDINAIYKMLNI